MYQDKLGQNIKQVLYRDMIGLYCKAIDHMYKDD